MLKSVKYLLLVFVLFGLMVNVSANTCEIVPFANTVDCDAWIMSTYAETNSHGATISNTPYKLCCDIPLANHFCDNGGSNGILRLSSGSNAHAEVYDLETTEYGVGICYGDLDCISHLSIARLADAYPIALLSLTGESNAHIGEYDDYDTKISCRDFGGVDAFWQNSSGEVITEITLNNEETHSVFMVLDNSPLACDADFDVYQNTNVGTGSVSTETISNFCGYESPFTGLVLGEEEEPTNDPTQCSCSIPDSVVMELEIDGDYIDSLVSEGDDIYELYFVVNQNNSDWTSGMLSVKDERVEPEIYWADNYGEKITSSQYMDESTLPQTLYLVVNDMGMPEGTEFEIDINEDDSGEGFMTSDDYVETILDIVTTNDVGNGFISIPFEFTETVFYRGSFRESEEYDSQYFEFGGEFINPSPFENFEIPILNVEYNLNPIQCGNIYHCSDYLLEANCVDDIPCDVADDQTSLPLGVSCDDSDINCFCSWNATNEVCNSAYSRDGIGSCSYDEDMYGNDNCDDGFLSYSWDAFWTWDPLNLVSQNDPYGDAAACESGSKIIACPAMIQLSFFNFWNLIGVVLLVILIYLFFGIKGKKKKVVRKKAVSKKKKVVGKKVKKKKRK